MEKGKKMRLIDADELEEKAWRFGLGTREDVANLIRNAPTVDAVPVVRCKDCVYFWDGVCTAHTDAICTDENEFCSWGERREDDTVGTV